MTIEPANGYKVGTAFFAALADAQRAALATLLNVPHDNAVIRGIVADAAKTIAILSPPKELRQRKRRADYQGKHRSPRKPETKPVTPELAS